MKFFRRRKGRNSIEQNGNTSTKSIKHDDDPNSWADFSGMNTEEPIGFDEHTIATTTTKIQPKVPKLRTSLTSHRKLFLMTKGTDKSPPVPVPILKNVPSTGSLESIKKTTRGLTKKGPPPENVMPPTVRNTSNGIGFTPSRIFGCKKTKTVLSIGLSHSKDDSKIPVSTNEDGHGHGHHITDISIGSPRDSDSNSGETVRVRNNHSTRNNRELFEGYDDHRDDTVEPTSYHDATDNNPCEERCANSPTSVSIEREEEERFGDNLIALEDVVSKSNNEDISYDSHQEYVNQFHDKNLIIDEEFSTEEGSYYPAIERTLTEHYCFKR